MPKHENKKFMESNAHSTQKKSGPKSIAHHYIGSDKRAHYGSGFMSDYLKSITSAKKRLTKKDKKEEGGSINQTRVY